MKKYLDFYKASINANEMIAVEGACSETSGLCDAFRIHSLFEIMRPTDKDIRQIQKEGKHASAWGSDDANPKWFVFTPLRQHIVLFMAAIAGELDE